MGAGWCQLAERYRLARAEALGGIEVIKVSRGDRSGSVRLSVGKVVGR